MSEATKVPETQLSKAVVESDSRTIDPGTTPGSAEGVDQSQGEDQSAREPAPDNSSSLPAEGPPLNS